MASETKFPRLPPSGIKVIIVGAGFGGLAAAIECDRKGHSVTVFEKLDDMEESQRGSPSAAPAVGPPSGVSRMVRSSGQGGEAHQAQETPRCHGPWLPYQLKLPRSPLLLLQRRGHPCVGLAAECVDIGLELADAVEALSWWTDCGMSGSATIGGGCRLGAKVAVAYMVAAEMAWGHHGGGVLSRIPEDLVSRLVVVVGSLQSDPSYKRKLAAELVVVVAAEVQAHPQAS
ncbi:hypothetical protein MAPG_06263 [Magnaporthiopsis poae ATCC 64411]|uniref:Uncharacterized protein n=1 Tax=Magnaporthiopsis poae (strain ATCC 64411 / 73-15) TaxID=644358 RepID=A0A0C4E1J9_MAGP6|nr:hypothetical protein MAPG_06263 [Magnaporthiopsis poae ATCC 64411]